MKQKRKQKRSREKGLKIKDWSDDQLTAEQMKVISKVRRRKCISAAHMRILGGLCQAGYPFADLPEIYRYERL